jgi:GPH family glycoside/pentoside/hexuronide:cation symporter
VSAERLPPRVLVAYAAPALPLALLGITFYVFLPKFYADVVGVDLGVLGAVVLASRMWDAVTDPVLGTLSDRTASRWGRRRPWMGAAILPLGTSFALLLTPPETSHAAIARLSVLTVAFFLAWTALAVPYEALGAEISMVYDERTRLLGAREGTVVLGTLLAAVIPVALSAAAGLGPDAADQRAMLASLSWGYGAILAVAVAWCLAAVPERPRVVVRRPSGGFLLQYKELLGNRPFRVLLLAYTVSSFGAALPATLIFFYTEHVLGSSRGPLFLVEYLAVGFAFLPAWVWLARKWEKRSAWLAAMAVNTGAFAAVLVLGRGEEVMFAVLTGISAIGLGGTVALPPAMQADVIDLDELEHGTRREGAFVGFWSVAKKLASALGAGVALPIVDAAGYVPGGPQPPAAIGALTVLYAGVPCVCNAAAFLVALRYRLDRAEHARIRAEIDARAAEGV